MERSIILRDWEVRAVIDQRKTRLSRVVKPQPRGEPFNDRGVFVERWHHNGEGDKELRCPFGRPGSRLWVKETFGQSGVPRSAFLNSKWPVVYEADTPLNGWFKRPSTHMPRWASRLTLEVTHVRVQRLQDISEEDARREGGPPSHPSIDKVSREFGSPDFPRSWFRQLWQSINGPGSWDRNDWIWAIDFKTL